MLQNVMLMENHILLYLDFDLNIYPIIMLFPIEFSGLFKCLTLCSWI